MSKPAVWIESVKFNDGTVIEFSNSDIVVFVGPNNCGKSASLKGIFAKAGNKSKPNVVIDEVAVKRDGTIDELMEWLENDSVKTNVSSGNPNYSVLGHSTNKNQANSYWNLNSELNALSELFICLLTTESRLQAANPAQAANLTTEPLNHPIHYLQKFDSKELRVSGYFKSAFGEDLLINRNAGKEVPLHCGSKPKFKKGEDRVSTGYLEKLEKLPTLHTQGDGMRAFVGVILHSLVVDHSVVLIDEPEAFLHPPQARLLGKMLVENAPPKRQLFVATHSSDFINGILDSNSRKVKIIRINRDGNTNSIRELNNQGIRKVWNDPLLRYSNILDGLFHSKVILCEGDSDCRFYAAISDVVFRGKSNSGGQNLMFTHCGGKYRMPVVISALVALAVPVVAVADFDVLSAVTPLRRIYEKLGGEWSDILPEWTIVKKAINQKKAEKRKDEVQKAILDILDGINSDKIPSESSIEISKVLKQSNPWALAKEMGSSFVPSGDATIAYTNLIKKLKKQGLYIVEVGEVEKFCKSVGNHGPKWVNEVLEKNLKKGAELAPARRFVKEFCK